MNTARYNTPNSISNNDKERNKSLGQGRGFHSIKLLDVALLCIVVPISKVKISDLSMGFFPSVKIILSKFLIFSHYRYHTG